MLFYYPLGGAAGGAASALAVAIRPDPAEYYNPSRYTTATVDVRLRITGGTAPYTAVWEYVSGDTEITIGSFTASPDNFFYAGNDDAAPHVFQAVWQVTVTDADGTTATDTVNVTLAFGTSIP